MSQPCSTCGQDTLIWSHRGAVERHRWEGGEGSCECSPLPVCVVCQLEVVRDNGLLLLDGEAFPSSTEALLN